MLDQLRERPYAFELFQALRLLELEGLRPGAEVRVSHEPHLWHTASDLAAVEVDGGRIRLFSHVYGMLGPSGPLPLRLAEDAVRQARGKRGPLADFMSMLGEAQLRSFYAAWRVGRLEMAVTGGESGQSIGIRSLTSGLDDPVLALQMLPQWRNTARGCEGLRATIHSLTGFCCEIEQLVGEWISIPANLRSSVGAARLGVDATVGSRQWSRHSRIRVRLQVHRWNELQDYLPSRGAGYALLRRVVAHYLLAGLVWTLDVQLPAAEVRGVRLGSVGRLGEDAWLDQPRSAVALARFGPPRQQ